MNYLQPITNEMSIEEAEKIFKEGKDLYNTLGGTVYKSAVYDDLLTIRRQLEKKKGCPVPLTTQ